jgi:alcohol dehydrogenase class IV
MNFEFSTASRIIFGPGALSKVGLYAASLGQNALIVTGKNISRPERLFNLLTDNHIKWQCYSVSGEPEIETIQLGVDAARKAEADLMIAFGGGSAIDTAKAIGALVTNPGDLFEYLEVIGKGNPLQNPSLPVIAIPTTAGTGSEVTRNAVLGVPERGLKISMRSEKMLPVLALVDPELTYSLPPHMTASTGMDAFTQLIEAFVSNRANPMIDALCREGIERIARSLRNAYWNGADSARNDMCLGSLFGGLALANAKLGADHGLAGVLGGKYKAPHGSLCARLLPEVIQVNVRALLQRDPQNVSLLKYREVARIVTQDQEADLNDCFEWVQDLCDELGIQGLSVYGVDIDHFHEIIPHAQNASSMQGNPIKLTQDELAEILTNALD